MISSTDALKYSVKCGNILSSGSSGLGQGPDSGGGISESVPGSNSTFPGSTLPVDSTKRGSKPKLNLSGRVQSSMAHVEPMDCER
jgi:hypothetical protein